MTPAPSTTAFSISISLRMAMAIHSSLTLTCTKNKAFFMWLNQKVIFKAEWELSLTILSIRFLAVSKAFTPTTGTARPSARLGLTGVKTGSPASSAAAKLGQFSASAPWNVHYQQIQFKLQLTNEKSTNQKKWKSLQWWWCLVWVFWRPEHTQQWAHLHQLGWPLRQCPSLAAWFPKPAFLGQPRCAGGHTFTVPARIKTTHVENLQTLTVVKKENTER